MRRVTLVLRNDLNDLVIERAAELGQNPNNFVNTCVEGCLEAMNAKESPHEIPIVKMYRTMRGKTFFDSKWVNMICSLFAPNLKEITDWHYHYLTQQMAQHEGPLTKEIMQFYWQQAIEMNQARVAREKELAKLKKIKGEGK
jgi:hypothetical protein